MFVFHSVSFHVFIHCLVSLEWAFCGTAGSVTGFVGPLQGIVGLRHGWSVQGMILILVLFIVLDIRENNIFLFLLFYSNLYLWLAVSPWG